MRECNARKKKRKKRRLVRRQEGEKRSKAEKRRTFRYRSPPHNRTSVTEGAIPDHLVSPRRGRPGHLAVTKRGPTASVRFFLRCLPVFSVFSLPLSLLFELSESINSRNSQSAHISNMFLFNKTEERKRGPHSWWSHFPNPRNAFRSRPFSLVQDSIRSFRANSAHVYRLRYVWYFNRWFRIVLISLFLLKLCGTRMARVTREYLTSV